MSKLEGKKILITGATGFIGSNLARTALRHNAEVHVLLREASNAWRIADVLGDLNVHYGDLSDGERVGSVAASVEPDLVFHTAIYGGHPFQGDVNKILDTNFFGTVNLVRACRDIDYELFVNTGSSSEYGIKPRRISEDDTLEPGDDYGVSKAASTLYCRMAAARDRKPIVTLRLFSPYGYYDDPTRLVPSVILSCLNGQSPKVSSPSYVRDFIFIDDVVDAYLRLPGVEGGIFNVGSGEQYSVGEVVDRIVGLTGNRVCPDWGNGGKRPVEPAAWQADVTRIRGLLRWAPSHDLASGLERTVRWFKENSGLYGGAPHGP